MTSNESKNQSDWHILGLKISKSADITSFTAMLISLSSIGVSIYFYVSSIYGSYKIDMGLYSNIVTLNFNVKKMDSDRHFSRLKQADQLESIAIETTFSNASDAYKPASIVHLKLITTLGDKNFVYQWDDSVVAHSATINEEVKEARPVSLNVGESKSEEYIFRLDTVNGEPYTMNSMPTVSDFNTQIRSNKPIVFRIIYFFPGDMDKIESGKLSLTSSTMLKQSKSCIVKVEEFNGKIDHRNIKDSSILYRKDGTFVMRCTPYSTNSMSVTSNVK